MFPDHPLHYTPSPAHNTPSSARHHPVTLCVVLGLALVSLGGIGCASKKFDKVSDAELPTDLPQDMQSKFEVKEASAAQFNQAVDPVPAASGNGTGKGGRKKGKKGSILATSAAAPKALVWPSRRPSRDPVWLGEKHVFDVSFFGLSACEATIEVLPFKAINNRKVYHIKGNAVTSKVFSMFYRVNDWIETFMDYEGLFSHRFHVVLDESKQSRDALELNDSEKAQTYYWNRWNHKDKGYSESKDFSPITPFSQDSLSSLYYMRSLPLADGAEYTFPVVSEGKSWEAVVKVVRREMMDTPLGKIRTIVLKPETKFQGVLQKKGDSFIWLSDDDRRWIVHVEAKVKIGTVVANLQKVEQGERPQ